MIIAFILCQLYVVLFIALHDWIPLGSLNNLPAVHSVDTTGNLVLTTVISTLPFAIGLAGTVFYVASGFPTWLMYWLWISYLAGAYGMLRTWWVPYLLIKDPARATRYQTRFADTHSFLPVRNGIRPDTLHVTFHGVLVTLIVLLSVLTFSQHAFLNA